MDANGQKAPAAAAAAITAAAAAASPDAGATAPAAAAAAPVGAAAAAGPSAPSAAVPRPQQQQQQQQIHPTPRTRIYYNPELSKFSLGEDHPMVPHRLHLTHRLAELWGLFDDPAVQVVRDYAPATTEQLRRFHTDEYIAFLEYLDTLDLENMNVEQQLELLGEDLALFGLSVCRPPAPPGAGDEEEEARPPPSAPPPQRRPPPPQQQRAPPVPQRPKPESQTNAGRTGYQPPQQQQLVKPEPKPEELFVPPQLIMLATQLLTKLAPLGSSALTPAQQAQLIVHLRQQQLQMQQKHGAAAVPAGALAARGPGGGAAAAAAGGGGSRVVLTMVRPGQVTAPGKAGAGGGGGGGGGGNSKKRKAESGGGGKGKGGGSKKSKKKKRRSYSDDDDEEEEISDEDDDPPAGAGGATAGGAAAVADAAAAGGAGGHSRPSRQAATAVAALTNAVRKTEAEESEDEDSEDEDDEDDDDEGGDCPIFPGLLRYVGLQAAGSILAARDLAAGLCDVAVHWGGGMHHGMPYRAFGFCYVNDLVLAILELMAVCGRVLYIDIDVHHGDGVETAFKRSEKVLSISLHKWDDGRMQASIDTLNHGKPQRPVFFPGTGKKNDLGEGGGKYYTVNVPLQDDITDDSYYNVYKAVVKTAFERFRPQAVVLQCGCDSVAGDKLGRFNLSIRGHSRCVELVRDLCRSGGVEAGAPAPPPAPGGRVSPTGWRIPLLVTGGGGYTPPLVARCWALETAVLLGRSLGEAMPPTVAAAEDLTDLGPSYFKEPGLSRPPKGNYQMCLDTIMLPHMHKQMDSDYSLSRLSAYLTSNMQRITIRDGPPATAAASPDAAAAAAGKDGEDGAATAKDGEAAAGAAGAKDGGEAGKAAGKGGKSASRKSAAASGPGVPDPLKHLTAPTGYPDAEEYIQDQKERVAAGAAWAGNMPPPPAAKGRKSSASAAAAGGKGGAAGTGASGGIGKNVAGGTAAAAAGGKGAAAGAAGGAAAPAGAVGKPAAAAGGSGAAAAGEAPAVTAGAAGVALLKLASFVPVQVPGVPVIRAYQPKTAAATATAAAAPAAAPASAGGQ